MDNNFDTYNYLVNLSQNRIEYNALIRYKGNDFEFGFLRFLFEHAKEKISIYYKNIEQSKILTDQQISSYIRACSSRNVSVNVVIVEDNPIKKDEIFNSLKSSQKEPCINIIKSSSVREVSAEKAHFIIADEDMYGLEYSEDSWLASLHSKNVVETLERYFTSFLKSK